MEDETKSQEIPHYLGTIGSHLIAWWAQSQDNINESLHKPEVMDADISRLGTIFLKVPNYQDFWGISSDYMTFTFHWSISSPYGSGCEVYIYLFTSIHNNSSQ